MGGPEGVAIRAASCRYCTAWTVAMESLARASATHAGLSSRNAVVPPRLIFSQNGKSLPHPKTSRAQSGLSLIAATIGRSSSASSCTFASASAPRPSSSPRSARSLSATRSMLFEKRPPDAARRTEGPATAAVAAPAPEFFDQVIDHSQKALALRLHPSEPSRSDDLAPHVPCPKGGDCVADGRLVRLADDADIRSRRRHRGLLWRAC